MSTLKQRFAELVKLRPEITQAEVARAAGVKPPSVNGWFSGDSKSMRASTATAVAALYGVSAHWLATGNGEMIPAITTPNVRFARSIAEAYAYTDNASVLSEAGAVPRGRLVPVVGTARLGENGFYEEVSSVPGSGDGLVDAYSSDPNAYALRVKGDSMFPAIRDGWYVVVEPNSAPQPGDYVLVKLKSGQKMVKELLMQRPDSITVSSVNGDVRKTIDMSEIDTHFGVQSVAAIVSPKKWRPE